MEVHTHTHHTVDVNPRAGLIAFKLDCMCQEKTIIVVKNEHSQLLLFPENNYYQDRL